MMNYLLVGGFSLLIGSFLNVLVFRLPQRESIIVPRSYCPLCGQTLKAADLIPLLSYIRLGGRCRYCKGKVKIQYPLVESLTMLLSMLIYSKWGLSFHFIEGCIFTALLITASFTDLNEGIIPDRLTYPGIISGCLLACFSAGIGNAILGAAVFGGFFLIIASVFQGGMGGGDIKLAALIGVYTGLQGAIMVFILSSLLAGLWVLPLCLQGQASRKTKIKLGPFLAIAAWVVWMYGNEMMLAYLRWLA